MLLSDLLNFTQILLAEPSSVLDGRWSQADLTVLINQAHTQIALDLDWPESTYTGTTVMGTQEYQLPETLKILRVYVAGMPIVPTTIPALGGDQLEIYDRSALNNQPQWTAQPEETYPIQTGTTGTGTGGWGRGADAGNTPWSIGNRPRFYMRGGNIGFVPIPAGAYLAQIDFVPQPPALVLAGDVSIYQTTFKDAICWKACEYAMFADNNSMMSTCTNNYQAELLKLRAWKEDLIKMLPRGVFPITARTNFRGPRFKRMTSLYGC
jgi:hypothetical protein